MHSLQPLLGLSFGAAVHIIRACFMCVNGYGHKNIYCMRCDMSVMGGTSDIEELECRLWKLTDDLRNLIRDTPLKDMSIAHLRRMERLALYVVRMLGSEIRALQKLKLEDSEDSDAETDSSSDDESLGGEDYRSSDVP